MPISLSKTKFSSYVGDITPLYLRDGELDLSTADIRWAVTGDAVTLREFSRDALTPFNHGVTLALQKPGNAAVSATLNGETYTCEITVRERRSFPADAPLQFYRGDLHTHTATTHTPEKFAARPHIQRDCVMTLKNDEKMDFGVLSDHACVMRRRGFFDGFVEAELAGETEFVLFPGSESEVTVLENDRFGLPHKHSGEIVLLNADNSSNVHDWQSFYDDLSTSPEPVGIFAHPIALGVGQNSFWSFPFERLRTPEMYRVMRGIEMGAGRNTGATMLLEYAYATALDNGFHISPTCGSDTHGPVWGFSAMNGKTMLMASEKSREAFLDALRNRRFYACESGNVKLRFTVNGALAPATLPLTDTYEICAEMEYFEENENSVPVCCQVISDGGATLAEVPVTDDRVSVTVHSDTARYFYLRLIDSDGRKTWSPAIWTGRAPDAPVEAAALSPIAPEGFTATELQSGADASAVLDGDPGVAFTTDTPTASILVDMKEAREIAALGYYVRRITKDWIKATSVDWKAEISARVGAITSCFVTHYAISTSVDGVSFTEMARGTIRGFGDEQILQMPRHRARYVRFDALSNVGAQSRIAAFMNAGITVGELTVFA